MRKIYCSLVTILATIFVSNAQIIITEISYNPPESGTDSLEYIEFYNLSSEDINLEGYTTEGVEFTFPDIILSGQTHIVIAKDSLAFNSVYGPDVWAMGTHAWEWTSGALSNGGEDIVLRDPSGVTIDSVNYDNTGGWPGSAEGTDGEGRSIERQEYTALNYLEDGNDPSNWAVSQLDVNFTLNDKMIYGSPGTYNFFTPYTLQILHASDLEGGVEAIGDAPRFAALIDTLEGEYENTIILSAGDNYIPGPFFGAADNFDMRPTLQAVYQGFFNEPGLTNIREAAGRADVTIMNVIGFDASALGNHEFDATTAAIADIILPDITGTELTDVRWLGARFPYLSANLDFTNDPELSEAYSENIFENTAFISPYDDYNTALAAPKLAPATFIVKGGEMIGVVGATTQMLATISSPGMTEVLTGGSNNMEALAALIQPQIDNLEALGINKIILVSHLQQFALESELAEKLSGIDVIVAGGSDAILANENAMLRDGDVASIPDYPVIKDNLDGNKVALVSTDGQYKYVGRLVVSFDMDGNIIPDAIDTMVSNPIATTPEMVEAMWGTEDAYMEGTKGYWVKFIADSVQAIVNERDGIIVGRSDVYLDGRRSKVRTEETNFGSLTADANLWYAQQHDPEVMVSLKNGGGIRAAIGRVVDNGGGNVTFETTPANPTSGKEAGEISVLDLENTLKFNNSLHIVTLSANGLKQIVEHGVAASRDGNTPGQFPQVAGITLEYDTSKNAGNRVKSLIINEGETSEDIIVADYLLQGDTTREIKVVTLNFLAGGGDGYPYPEHIKGDVVELENEDDALVNPQFDFVGHGTEQDALAEYLYETTIQGGALPFDMEETSAENDMRIMIASTVTSIYTSEEVTTLNVYPNPTAGELNFSKAISFSVYDLNGKALATYSNTSSITLDLASGVYLIVTTDGEQFTVFIK